MSSRRKFLAMLGGTVLVGGMIAWPAAADASSAAKFTATELQPASTISAAKSPSGQLAESDPSLLRRTDATEIQIMVKLDYDAAASYGGGVDGLAATSPQVTGRQFSKSDPAVAKYLKHADAENAAAAAAITRAVPGARVTAAYSVVYGGLSVRLPANKAKTLLAVAGVAAVQQDQVNKPTAESESLAATIAPTSGSSSTIPSDTAKFVGATAVWPSLGGQKLAGKGVIVGVLDTGIWPEHPMLADGGYLGKPGPSGKTWACQFGDGSDAALGAPFTCNNKLIGAYAFTDTNLSVNGTVPGEFCDTSLTSAAHPYGTCSARDADGHGTHTSTTAAGDPVTTSPLLGVDRGPISGIAPGASVIMYRVCLTNGCYSSDSVRAVNQAITDGVNVINFSIGGGANAYTDPVELAFLDAYAAGINVTASAGNSGPGAATAEHGGPWVTTVAASTSDRAFESTLTLSSSDGSSYTKVGATITAGVAATPVVRAQDVPGYTGTAFCLAPFASGSLTGKVVVCERGGGGGGRVEKGYFASLGGAAGFILYNPTVQDTETDNHFLPAIHLEGPNDDMLAFLAGHPNVTASWGRGEKVSVQGDVMAGFSSRGPVGTDFIKPDVTAPGVQVLAGASPAHIDIPGGPQGELYQAIAGTSMSSPHAAGIATLLRAAHPNWTPGQIKSAMMTSSVQSVVTETGAATTVWDRGSGSLRANRAVSPTVTFDVTAADYAAGATDALDRVDLNLPSIDADPLPGVLTTTRFAKNVSGRRQSFDVVVKSDAGLAVTVSPKSFTLSANSRQKLTISIDGTDLAADARAYAQVTLKPKDRNATTAVIPVAVHRAEGSVSLTNTCSGNPVQRDEVSTCTVTATNRASVDATSKITVTVPSGVTENFVSSPAKKTSTGASWSGTLTKALPAPVDSVLPGASPAGGYLPLSLFGIGPVAGVGDETITNFDVSPFQFGGATYTKVAVDSNGYVIVGGSVSSSDNECCELPGIPSTTPPNNIIAPFWTDLNPATGGAIRVGTLTDGVGNWLVIDYDKVVAYGSSIQNSFQVWIQLGATEGQWISYGTLGGANGQPLNSGVENADGTSGVAITAASDSEFVVTMGDPTPGGTVSFRYQVSSRKAGSYGLVASLTTPIIKGSTTKKAILVVTR